MSWAFFRGCLCRGRFIGAVYFESEIKVELLLSQREGGSAIVQPTRRCTIALVVF